MERHLHIISFDVPYPDDYGGVIDVFHKIISLHRKGVHIHLHCFDYGRKEQAVLENYCTSVHYYKRKTGLSGLSLRLPYIVSSRVSEELFSTLLRDKYPILVEGIHCSYLLQDTRFSGRRIFLRLHNAEYLYYRNLNRSSGSPLKKMYYLFESRLLLDYERKIAGSASIIAFTDNDVKIYKDLGAKTIISLPAFVPYHQVQSKTGKGCFCLYHGNLSVAENERSALFLVNEVFQGTNIPLILAGKNPTGKLIKAADGKANICLVANPSPNEMNDLVQKAQVNVLPSFNTTGLKLKLISALFNGRYCVVNKAAVSETGLEPLCCIAETSRDLALRIKELFEKEFDISELNHREKVLGENFNNDFNAGRLIQLIW